MTILDLLLHIKVMRDELQQSSKYFSLCSNVVPIRALITSSMASAVRLAYYEFANSLDLSGA